MTQRIQDASKISLVVRTLNVVNGRSIGELVADNDGYFDMPLAAFGVSTRNKTYYSVDSMLRSMTDPSTAFYQRLHDGQLVGENGHPDLDREFPGLDLNRKADRQKALKRTMNIADDRVCCHIKDVWSDEGLLEDGGKLLVGKVAPAGELGHVFERNMKHKGLNASMSLRALMRQQHDAKTGLSMRDVTHMITFDHITGAGGYPHASKRYSPKRSSVVASEGFDIPVSREDFYASEGEWAFECLKETELNELFKTDDIQINTFTYTLADNRALIDAQGNRRSKMFVVENQLK